MAGTFDNAPTPEQRAREVMLSEPEFLERRIAEEIGDAVRDVLARIGNSGICDTCGNDIWWLSTINGGRRVPYSARGVPHTLDCRMAGRPGKLGRWEQGNAAARADTGRR